MDRPTKGQKVVEDTPRDDFSRKGEPSSEASNPVLEASAKDNTPLEEIDQKTRENIHQMLQEFQDNLSSSLVAKKKMVKQELNNSFKTLNAKLEFIFRREQNERKKQYSQYCEIFESCYSQWQKEMDRVEEEDEKLAAMTHKQKEIAVLNRMTQNMAVGTIMSLYETFMQNVESLAENPPPLDESEEQDETS